MSLHEQRPSQEEYFSLLAKETPEQDALYNQVLDLVGNPQFVDTSIVNAIMKVGLWRSVEKGELTQMQGAQIEAHQKKAFQEYIASQTSQKQSPSDL